MTVRYVDSAATGANDGTTWANAFTTLAGAAAVDTAGDVIYVKSTHSESTAGAVTWDWAGTTADPVRVICVSDSNEPPTTVATGAVVTVTGANNLATCSSSDVVYFYGIRFKAGDSTNAADVQFAASGSCCIYEECAFELAGNNSGSDFTVLGPNFSRFINCTFKSVNSGSQVGVNGIAVISGGSIESGGTPGSPFFSYTSNSELMIRGFDFTNLNAAANLSAVVSNTCSMTAINCRMPSAWSGSINSSDPGVGSVFTLMNSDSADTNYRLQVKTSFGQTVHETTIKRTGGASDGTTGISWNMTSNGDVEWSHQTLDSPEIVKWNETTGSSVTATVEFVHDSVTNMTDKEIWLEVMYLGTSGFPLGSTVSDAAANYLATGADQTDSSETWTTTGMTNPNTQKLSVTFTPQEKGFVHGVVKLAKASKTVYVDPVLTIA